MYLGVSIKTLAHFFACSVKKYLPEYVGCFIISVYRNTDTQTLQENLDEEAL